MSSKGLEQDKCRGPLAASVNMTPFHKWVPVRNHYGSKCPKCKHTVNIPYEVGRPDGEIRKSGGRVVDVECKAALERWDIRLWTQEQRNWMCYVSQVTDTHYYVALWLAGSLYMIPGFMLQGIENELRQFDEHHIYSSKTIPGDPPKYAAEILLREYRLEKPGRYYQIPTTL